VLAHHQNDTGEFATGKPTALLEADRIQPDLGAIGISLDMHMRWLGTVAREEEETVRSDTQDSWHGE